MNALTKEQTKILSDFKAYTEAYKTQLLAPKALVVDAGAGTGKTSTVMFLAQDNPDKNFAMVCFNKANAAELNERAASLGLPNITAWTMHKLAYDWFIGFKSTKTINTVLDMTWLRDNIALPMGLPEQEATQRAWDSIKLLNMFFSAQSLTLEEFLQKELPSEEYVAPITKTICETYLELGLQPDKSVPVTLNGILKYYQQQQIQAFQEDTILVIEEYQDVNPVQARWILEQKNFLLLIGDRFQAIYSWRQGGTLINEAILHQWPKLNLTLSFRVNPDSALLANKILTALSGPTLIGGSTKTSIATKAYLFRTNAEVVRLSFQLMGEKVKHVLAIDLARLWDDFWWLNDRLANKPLKRSKSSFRHLKTKKEVLDAATYMPEVGSMLKLLQLFSARGGLYANQKKFTMFQELSKNSPIVLSTAHKSKGLEWDEVHLGEDFGAAIEKITLLRIEEDSPELRLQHEEELRLLYVALTRSKVKTELPSDLHDYILNLTSFE